MTTVEILAPLRIETRFYAPDDRRPNWLLKLRVYPDEFSMALRPPAPTSDELDLYDVAMAASYADPNADPHAAFLLLAGDLGPARALWLLRNIKVVEIDGVPMADRAETVPRHPEEFPETTQPMGLPPRLAVWLLTANGVRTLGGEMELKREEIAADLDFRQFDESLIRDGKLADTWWTSYERARSVGLALDIELHPDVPEFEAIVVCGMGEEGPQELIDAQAASGRMALLHPGTPTNTVEGEATTEMGRDPRVWTDLLDGAPPPAAEAIIKLLSGGKSPPVPLLGGDSILPRYDLAAVRGLWPLLWGQALRDMVGAGGREEVLREWARDYLSPQGPYPAIRIGEQPYGLLPIVSLGYFTSSSGLDESLARWGERWRAEAANVAAASGNVADAGTARLVELIGEDAPSRRWGVRPVLPRVVVNLLRQAAGEPPLEPNEWEIATAKAFADLGQFERPLAPFANIWPLPQNFDDKPDDLRALFEFEKSGFPKRWPKRLGLFGHLVTATLLLLRARLRVASDALDAGGLVDPDAPLPIYGNQDQLRSLAAVDEQQLLQLLFSSGNAGAYEAAKRYDKGRADLWDLIGSWEEAPGEVLDALFATLDTASHRVDPWATGLADARLRKLLGDGAPFRLGAYGWVDRPRAANGGPGSPPAPGPTDAGLLHAPSYGQALTAALLRDRAVRYRGETNWQMTIDSAKVRGAIRLAERVRLGVHPYEALGLEVERLVGDWDAVRVLRQHFPLRITHQGQRCCDGARVLRAVFTGAEPLPAGLLVDLETLLAPVRDVLDSYADLLLADGVHALISGEGETAIAAMEAAAGLGAPPDMRAMRTPREARTVRVSAWVLLPPGEPGNSPATLADPAFAALVDHELGPPTEFTWSLGGAPVSLDDYGLHAADIFDLDAGALAALLRGPIVDATLVSTGGAERLVETGILANLLGGGEDNPPVPGDASGRDDANAAETELRTALRDDLASRLEQLRVLAEALVATLDATDGTNELERLWLERQLKAWRLADTTTDDALDGGRAALVTRLAAVEAGGGGINDLRAAIRALAGQPRLPVVPVVEGVHLGNLVLVARSDDDHPLLDTQWLETVAAVRPRLASLEARQLDPGREPWQAAISDGVDPWTTEGPVVIAYGPGVAGLAGPVGVVGLDAWVDSIPNADHTTSAAFGFNGPKSRPPQAILLAVPPDIDQRMNDDQLLQTVIEARLSARARAIRPGRGVDSFVATPSGLGSEALGFTEAW